MTSTELENQITTMQNDIWADIQKLSELKSNYNCFDEKEEPYYRALSNAIEALRHKASLLGNRYHNWEAKKNEQFKSEEQWWSE